MSAVPVSTRDPMIVAETIRAQLGGNRFDVMTGAKLHTGGPNYLQFRLPARFARNGITSVRITLNERDLYDMEFFNIRGLNVRKVAELTDVHVERLRAVFTEQTGLDTSL